MRSPLTTYHLSLLLTLAIDSTLAANEPPFRFEGNPLSFRAADGDAESTAGNTSALVWQPLRATFRPLNRQPPSSTPAPPTPPSPPTPPADVTAPDPPEFGGFEALARFGAPPPPPRPTTSSTTPAPPTTTSRPSSSLDDEDQPTRVPLSRFRPTKSPSVDPQAQPSTNVLTSTAPSGDSASNSSASAPYRMSQECFECICEASTSCNANSRCQTSDVRHTRCGMFLISYDQWLDSGLSRELVSREALARDAAADERAFYECVTSRDCAERLLATYMARNGRDCDKDGRIDCYDLAAIHQGGTDQCNSESLLESQYWSDFNACFGFGR